MKGIFRTVVMISALASLTLAQTPPPPPATPVDSPWTVPPLNGRNPVRPRPLGQRTQPVPSILLGNEVRPSASLPNSLVITTTAGPVKLGPGDLVDIGVFDSPELTTRARVNSDGDITFPLLGRLHVGGATPEQTQEIIGKQLADKDFVKNPQVAVFVVEYANQAVYVLGEVNRPGAYPVMGSHRLFDFISAAGGFAERAGRSITITRREADQPETVRMGRNPDFTAGNPDIAAGDTVYVGQAGLVYVVGDVVRAGGFLVDTGERMTVMQALALAQGVKPTASLKNARLVRTSDQGRQEIALDLKKIFSSQDTDPTLQDQDIIYVPNSASKTGFRRGMEAALQTVVGVAIYRR